MKLSRWDWWPPALSRSAASYRRRSPTIETPQRFLRSDPRAYVAVNQAFAAKWQAETGNAGDQAIARRLGQAGARRDRRPGGRRRHPGARLRHRRHRRCRPARQELAGEAARQQHALHLDHRVPGAQGQSEADQGLVRPREAGRPGHHAQSEDLGRRALELPGRLGLCARPQRRRRGEGEGLREGLYKHVPVLDSGARGSTVTFVERGIGDVLVAWENEAFLAVKELGPEKVEIVVPPRSIVAEPVAVDSVVDAHGTRKLAEAYLQFLIRRRARRSRPRISTARASPMWRRNTPPSSPSSTSSPSARSSAPGGRREEVLQRRRRLPTRSTSRDPDHRRPA